MSSDVSESRPASSAAALRSARQSVCGSIASRWRVSRVACSEAYCSTDKEGSANKSETVWETSTPSAATATIAVSRFAGPRRKSRVSARLETSNRSASKVRPSRAARRARTTTPRATWIIGRSEGSGSHPAGLGRAGVHRSGVAASRATASSSPSQAASAASTSGERPGGCAFPM